MPVNPPPSGVACIYGDLGVYYIRLCGVCRFSPERHHCAVAAHSAGQESVQRVGGIRPPPRDVKRLLVRQPGVVVLSRRRALPLPHSPSTSISRVCTPLDGSRYVLATVVYSDKWLNAVWQLWCRLNCVYLCVVIYASCMQYQVSHAYNSNS